MLLAQQFCGSFFECFYPQCKVQLIHAASRDKNIKQETHKFCFYLILVIRQKHCSPLVKNGCCNGQFKSRV